jgi:hypothetical protein
MLRVRRGSTGTGLRTDALFAAGVSAGFAGDRRKGGHPGNRVEVAATTTTTRKAASARVTLTGLGRTVGEDGPNRVGLGFPGQRCESFSGAQELPSPEDKEWLSGE